MGIVSASGIALYREGTRKPVASLLTGGTEKNANKFLVEIHKT